jgi:hypothetical protein
MVERNMIREGFIFNTATSPLNPTFSGSQIVNEKQATDIADENISVSAVTVSATENINLTADLGARWKLNRIELYTDDPSAVNILMDISDNNVEFFPVTMTGSPNLYVGDILDSTISGAPRYIRYNHAAASDVEVFEWKAINDDTLVDFGSDGTQTEVEIEDAPVGRVSDNVQNLQLFNRFHKPGAAFVFIDDTGTAADELFEISTSSNGPWFGRNVQESLQPDNVPWVSGTLDGTHEVAASGFYMNWYDNQSGMSWTPTDSAFSAFNPDPIYGGSLSYITTGLTPTYRSPNAYTDGLTPWQTVTAGVGNINSPHLRNVLVDTDLFDSIRVRLKVSPLALNDTVEGPRVRWRWVDDDNPADPFPLANSSLSQFPFSNFTGDVQDFIFKVGDVPTWSGAPFHMIRGLEIDPFITVTGIGNTYDLYEIEAFNSNGQSRVILDRQPTQSGSRPILIDNNMTSFTSSYSWLLPNTRITQPCIITKVSIVSAGQNSTGAGIFLYRETPDSGNYNFPGVPPIIVPGNDPNIPGGASGDNFEVVATCQFRSMNSAFGTPSTNENWVFWRAEPGDMLGVSSETHSGWTFRYQASGDSNISSWYARNVSSWGNAIVDMESSAVCQSDLNNQDSWEFTTNGIPQVWCNTVSLGSYLANGTYTTPIFDGGVQPSLISSSFVAIEARDSKIDSNTSDAFKTISARASDFPPVDSADMGEVFNYDNLIWGYGPENTYPDGQHGTARGTFPVRKWINEETPAPAGNDWQINHINGFVTNRENLGESIKNLGGAMLHHTAKDELWVMNCLASGILPNDIRPIWDVYNPDSLEYVRTDHVKGQLTYSYRATVPNNVSEEDFEPVGFIYDEAYDEIYIIQRENSFFLGTVSYYALVMDTEGNFKRLAWRSGAMGETANRMQQMTSVAFDGTYHYVLTSNTTGTTSFGDYLEIIKRGDTNNLSDNTQTTVIASFDLSTLPGLEGADGNPITQQCIYNSVDGLLYLFFGDPLNSGDNYGYRNPEMYALRVTIDDDVLQSIVKVPLVDPWGTSTTEGIRLSELGQKRDAYSGNWAGPDSANDRTDLITNRSLNFLSASCYDSHRDAYHIISSVTPQFWNDWDARENWRRTNNDLYDKKTLQMFYSCSAGTLPISYGDTPVNPKGSDPNWGTLSGTLGWESLQENSVLFPTGRYGQMRYTLNSSPDFVTTPQLLTSQLDQGIRAGTVPASGTTDLWLRTDIPEDQPLGDLTSGLKVFWELPE